MRRREFLRAVAGVAAAIPVVGFLSGFVRPRRDEMEPRAIDVFDGPSYNGDREPRRVRMRDLRRHDIWRFADEPGRLYVADGDPYVLRTTRGPVWAIAATPMFKDEAR